MNDFEQFKASVEEVKTSIFGEMDTLIAKMEQSGDLDKFYEKGVRSAASRLRKDIQLIRKSIHHPTTREKMNVILNGAKELREKLK
jgi:hypothetical protein